MGLQRVMVRLEVLEKVTHRPRGCSKSKYTQLGAAKPRAMYKVLHNKRVLANLIERFAGYTVKPEGKLANESLLKIAWWLTQDVFPHDFTHRTRG